MADRNIVIVEDDPSVREALKLFLELEGYNVFTAADGKEAFELLPTIPGPCLILLDLMMPVMDGYEFLRQRKQDTAIASIPVIVASAFLESAKNVEAQGFVPKPIDLEPLLKFVKQYCG